MHNLSAGALKNVPILCPPINLQNAFAEFVDPQFEFIESLMDQNQNLTKARDLLLPRLMSGAIAV